MNQSNFLNNIRQGSFTTFHKYKILPSITAAQAILESNWGKSQLAKECRNLFGIKADDSWEGKKKAFQTKEYDKNGNAITVMAYFRKYNSYEESLNDHGKFFHINKRYVNIIGIVDYKEQAKSIQKAGYATDPHYANKLVQLIKQNNLQNWDKEILSSPTNTQQTNQFIHIVKKGETINQIAQKYNIPIQEIIKNNQLKNPNLIYPSQSLNIPVSETEPQKIYTVKKGDTLSAIAKKFNTTVRNLAEVNNILDVNKIKTGQKIYVNLLNNSTREGE